MSGWHREHPELTGTDADPWMQNPAHAAASLEVEMIARFPNLDAMIADAEFNSSHVCRDCGEVQCVEPRHGICRRCGGRLVEREP